MKYQNHTRTVLLIFLALLTLLSISCISSSKNIRYSGLDQPISSSTLKQVKPGDTTKQWLIATLGEPTDEHTTDQGLEILKYTCKRTENYCFSMFLILTIRDEKERINSVVFEIKDDIVQRYWKEG
jgi:hypothetical protein